MLQVEETGHISESQLAGNWQGQCANAKHALNHLAISVPLKSAGRISGGLAVEQSKITQRGGPFFGGWVMRCDAGSFPTP